MALLPAPIAAMLGGVPAAQESAGAPAFEVAAVKQNKGGEGAQRIQRQPGGRFNVTNYPVWGLIAFAHQVQGFQIEGGPGWIRSERFDIVAKAEGDPAPTPIGGPPDPMVLMLRTLLADRFKLVMHKESREMPIYALVRARSDGALGPQIRESSTDCEALMAAARRGGAPPPQTAPGERPLCGLRGGPASVMAGGFPLSSLASTLAQRLQRMVVDRTGLTGNFDFHLTWTPDQLASDGLPAGGPSAPLPPIDPDGPSLFTAVQEQLGLRLESTRGLVEVVVIDRIERPEE